MSGLIEIKTGEEAIAFVRDPTPGVLHFSATWAPSCVQVNELLKDLVEDSDISLRTAFIDAEALPGVSLNFKITAAPTLVYIRNGHEVYRVDGFNPSEIKEKALLVVTQTGPVETSVPVSAAPKENLNDRLHKLTNARKVMLFMKGDPEQPRCGFSRTIIELLKQHDIDFGSFDILSDDVVRQGLKEYSNWPTYPQLYFEGELVGGLDVVKEEFQDAEFVARLPKNADKKNALETRLKSIINEQRLTLFMKGDKTNPRCGFSRQIVDLLNNAKADYGTFDILSDEEVRQGLKVYSNWPTYPQLYLDGELIGGLDVVKEELLDTQFLRSIPRVGRD